MNLHLDFREGDDMYLDAAAAEAQLPGQVQHFFLRPVRSIGIAVEMDRIDLHAALRDHPSRHRAVNASGQEQGGVSVGSHRHPADGRNHPDIQIGHVPDFDIQHMIRMVHIHLQVGIGVQDPVAGFFIDGWGIHRIPFVTSPGIYFEGSGQVFCHFDRLVADRVEILLGHLHCRGNAVHTEHAGDPVDACLGFAEPADQDPPVMHMDVRSHAAHGIPDFPDKRPDKVWAVQPLQEYFPVPYHQQILHPFYLRFICGYIFSAFHSGRPPVRPQNQFLLPWFPG